MSYELTETERNAALHLVADYRYDHFVSKAARHGMVWILKDEEGPLLLDSEGEACLPVWPHPDYAQAWVDDDELAGFVPQSVTLPVWIEQWAAGLSQDGIAVAVFPLQDAAGIVEDAEDLAATLRERLVEDAKLQ